MVGREISATEIGKHSQLIKSAQEEMSTIDVLVCGRCLTVCHFVEDFEKHKQSPCSKENNNIRECKDTKPKIWAFLLWKATQLHNNKNNNNGSTTPNSWTLYQTWVKMDESVRDTWVMAGRTIQSFSKVGQGGLQEMPVKITKTVVNNNANAANDTPARKPLTQTKPQVTNAKTTKLAGVGTPKSVAASDIENENKTGNVASSASSTPSNTQSKLAKKSPVSAASSVGSSPLQGKVITLNLQSPKGATPSRRATRSSPNSDELVQENVEKIVAKRFNPRRKMHEYLVKWDGRPHDQNTWEPISHLDQVAHLREIFEKQLARQKENRAALQAKQNSASSNSSPQPGKLDAKTDGKKAETISNASKASNSTPAADKADSNSSHSPSIRPTRTSKIKAMDQVKQWVSNESPANSADSADADNSPASINSSGGEKVPNASAGAGLKRKFNDSADDLDDLNASDTPSATASTMEDLEEDLIPSHTVKRMKNGTGVSVESKLIRMNGTNSRGNPTSFSGESIPVGPKSAEVIITKEKGVSGVVRKHGHTGNVKSNSQKPEAQIRILSKEESAVMNTGIVRTSQAASKLSALLNSSDTINTSTNTSTNTNTNSSPSSAPRTPQQIRMGVGRQTPTTNSASSMRSQHIVQRTASGTIIQRKPLTPGQRALPGIGARSATQLPSSGRMVIQRGSPATRSGALGSGGKVVTPEQKILQLSQSGNLKVTKKMMTREDAVAQRLGSQQLRQQQLQRQQQQQSQVQIQKVQQLAPPNSARSVSSVSVRKRPDGTYSAHEEQSQSKLCPITEEQPSSQQLQAQMLTAAAAAEQQHQQQLALQQQQQQQQQQQESSTNDQTLLLTSDQLLTNEDGTPLLVTGEDGTVYQVAGKNAEGQTILVTQGPDGEQQFAYVATAEGDENQVLTLDNAVAEAVSQLPAEQQAEALAGSGNGNNQYLVKTTQEDGTTHMVAMTEAELQQHQALMQQQIAITEAGSNTTTSTTTNVAVAGSTSAAGAGVNQLCIQTGDGSDGQEANIPAEVVQAELPSPGGTRRVVLLLQDGTFMMTEMQDDEFKALNIAA